MGKKVKDVLYVYDRICTKTSKKNELISEYGKTDTAKVHKYTGNSAKASRKNRRTEPARIPMLIRILTLLEIPPKKDGLRQPHIHMHIHTNRQGRAAEMRVVPRQDPSSWFSTE